MPLTSTAVEAASAVAAEADFMRSCSSSRRSFFISSSCAARRGAQGFGGGVAALPTKCAATRATSASRRNSLERAGAGDGFDAADAGGDGGFADELEQADLAGGGGVGAAAELGREVADLDDADAVAVLFAEERHGAELVDGDVDGDVDEGLDGRVGEDLRG